VQTTATTEKNKIKQNKTKQNKTKQNKTKQNKTKRNKKKNKCNIRHHRKSPISVSIREYVSTSECYCPSQPSEEYHVHGGESYQVPVRFRVCVRVSVCAG
jgi:hypothetical protein